MTIVALVLAVVLVLAVTIIGALFRELLKA
jgi:hypothetical protein